MRLFGLPRPQANATRLAHHLGPRYSFIYSLKNFPLQHYWNSSVRELYPPS
jgi:hypothetical protein